jgi:hypothetical protein
MHIYIVLDSLWMLDWHGALNRALIYFSDRFMQSSLCEKYFCSLFYPGSAESFG